MDYQFHFLKCILLYYLLYRYCDQIRDLGVAYLLHKPLENTADWFHTLQQQRFGTGSPDSPKERIDSSNLELREDDEGKVFTKGLTVIPVSNTTEVMSILQVYIIIYFLSFIFYFFSLLLYISFYIFLLVLNSIYFHYLYYYIIDWI